MTSEVRGVWIAPVARVQGRAAAQAQSSGVWGAEVVAEMQRGETIHMSSGGRSGNKLAFGNEVEGASSGVPYE